MRVSLFVTCLIDQFWPTAGTATVEVLRRAGCEVVFDPEQTCCGQPAFNTGYLHEARDVALRWIEMYERAEVDAIVLPSGSCCAMVHHMAELFEPDQLEHERAKDLSERTHELGSFLVRVLGIDDLDARYPARLTWHDACHGLRDLGIREEPRRLLKKVREAELVEAKSSDSCCGFGGTFSVKHPNISIAMLDQKLQALELLDVDTIVSGDVSCLMQIGGRLAHRRSPIRAVHLAEVLAGSPS